jgi:hypothetical protein
MPDGKGKIFSIKVVGLTFPGLVGGRKLNSVPSHGTGPSLENYFHRYCQT